MEQAMPWKDNPVVGIIGLGYVGLPLSVSFASKKVRVIGFDTDESKVDKLNSGESYISHIQPEEISGLVSKNDLEATADFSRLSEVDCILICVPTPITKHKEPDLSSVTNTGAEISKYLRKGQLIILESSTYPGTTNEVLGQILEKSGLKMNEDFFIAYSPEREDPGNQDHSTSSVPKVLGADNDRALQMAKKLYEIIVPNVVLVSSASTAEAVKLTENIFRSVNIALVNELKVIFEPMGIDIWEVIHAASTKPFGYMPFYPGPGLGGHCIPVDPFYLSFKAKEFGLRTRFIELAGEVNASMPEKVVSKCVTTLSHHVQKSLNGSRILVIGLAYKPDVDDMRESPSCTLIELLEKGGAKAEYHDPFIPVIPESREHKNLSGRVSTELNKEKLQDFDLILISTNHSVIDYQLIAENASLVVDTRNSMKDISGKAIIVKA